MQRASCFILVFERLERCRPSNFWTKSDGELMRRCGNTSPLLSTKKPSVGMYGSLFVRGCCFQSSPRTTHTRKLQRAMHMICIRRLHEHITKEDFILFLFLIFLGGEGCMTLSITFHPKGCSTHKPMAMTKRP